MSTELAIVKEENIKLIVSNAPAAYNENKVSQDRCLAAGNKLLEQLRLQDCTDELDQQAAVYIDRARKTVKKMNDKRAPLTKLFDEIRTEFTQMENSIDPTKSGTVPYLIQQQRNQYAAKKRQEEVARQREELLRQQRAQAKTKFTNDCDSDYRTSFNGHLDFYLEGIQSLFSSVTLENYDQRLKDLQGSSVAFPADFSNVVRSKVAPPPSNMVSPADVDTIRKQVLERLLPQFRIDFENAMITERQRLVDLMPSKKQELERAARASAEEAERIKKQMEEKEAADAARMAAERQQKEQQQRAVSQMEAKKAEVGNLFNQSQVQKPVYQPKTSVKKRLVPLNVEAFPEIFQLWWVNEGCNMSVDDLAKMFKKQITACEKLAKDGTFIQSEHLYYEDEVKAK